MAFLSAGRAGFRTRLCIRSVTQHRSDTLYNYTASPRHVHCPGRYFQSTADATTLSSVVPSVSETTPASLLADATPSEVTSPLVEILCTSHTPVDSMSWYNLGQYVMDAVNLTHDVTGVSYAASIAAVTAICRMALFPLGVWSRRNQSRRDIVEPQVQILYKKYKENRDPKAKNRLAAQIRALQAKHGYKPQHRYIAPVVTISTFITMWYGLRWMGYYYPEEMLTGGVLWFVDLSKPDPIMFLPLWSCLSFFVHGELGADSLGRPSKELSWKQMWFWRVVRVVVMPILCQVPAAVHCFWIPNTMMGIGQSVLLSKPNVMRKLDIYVPPEAAILNTQTSIDLAYSKLNKNKGEEGHSSNEEMTRTTTQNDDIVFYKDVVKQQQNDGNRKTQPSDSLLVKKKAFKKRSSKRK